MTPKIGDTAGKEELMEANKFFFMSMKERIDIPIGPLLLDYLQEKWKGFTIIP